MQGFVCIREAMSHHPSAPLVRTLLAVALFSILSVLLGAAPKSSWIIREWDLPGPNSRPHDPAVAPDGSLWYTAELSNRLGRLDPTTGSIREFPLGTPDSGPHGLVADRNGKIWYTANHKGLIGELDPKTGRVTEHEIHDQRGRDPHTPVFDQWGILWFTAQNGNAIGRLVPTSARFELVTVPTPHAKPYGIAVNSRGVPFFAEFGTNKLGSIDPKSLEIVEYTLPSAESRPRRIAIAADDTVYYSDYARGYLGQFDPKTGEQREWPSPGGGRSEPYAIAITRDGIIWYSESGVTPNTIVRFDPRTEQPEARPVPSGGGVIRTWPLLRTAAFTSPAAASTKSGSSSRAVERRDLAGGRSGAHLTQGDVAQYARRMPGVLLRNV